MKKMLENKPNRKRITDISYKDKEYVSLYKDPNCTASAEITEANYPSYFWNDTMTSTKRSEWVVNGDLYIYIEGQKKFNKTNWENSQ